MDEKVSIRVETDPSMTGTEVIIRSGASPELIAGIARAIENSLNEEHPKIAAYDGNSVILVEQKDIVRVYSENRRIKLCTESSEHDVRLSLRDMEMMLDPSVFVRISRFEIVNLKKVTGFDLNMVGTIRVNFTGGSFTWVARRYVREIQNKLVNICGGGDGR
ncbi:MAG: LytTR family transcriptional regulator [Lachnospiraceae bacterium]|nr:LytTR family transcriptional regulator [Lachnospiraceae bacterium]